MSWDESKHPRVPAGSSEGGQFTAAEGAARRAAGVGSVTSKEYIKLIQDQPNTMVNWIDPRNTAFLTEDGSDIRGQVEMQVRDDPYTGEPRVYFNIIVPEHQRRKGYGTEILQEMMAMADETGVTLFGQPGTFGHGEKMTDKQLWRWYLKMGFKKKGAQIFYRGGRP